VEYDCGKTGCTGGGTFVFAVFAVWLVLSFWILFEDPISLRKYIKDLPERLIIFTVVSAILFGVGWVLASLDL